MKARLPILALSALLLSGLAPAAATYTAPALTNPTPSVSLAWDPSPDPACTGYNVYVGVASRAYTNFVAVAGTNTTATISPLVRGATYYFTVTAIYPGPLESDFCNEVSYTPRLPAKPGTLRNPIALVVQSKPPDNRSQWADAGMDWSLSADQASQVFRLAIVRAVEVAQAPSSPQTRALSALRKVMNPPPAPN